MSDEQDSRDRRSLRVASRAVRRGRKLKPSVLPPVPLERPIDTPSPTSDDVEDWADPPLSKDDWSEGENLSGSVFATESLDAPGESPFDAGEPTSDGIRIGVHDSTFPLPMPDGASRSPDRHVEVGVHDSTFPIARTSSLRPAPSIRVYESLMPDGVGEPEDDVAPPPSLRFSRPPAPMMDLAARRSTRPPTPTPPADDDRVSNAPCSAAPASAPLSRDDVDGPPTRRASDRPDASAPAVRTSAGGSASSIGTWAALGLMGAVAGWIFARAAERVQDADVPAIRDATSSAVLPSSTPSSHATAGLAVETAEALDTSADVAPAASDAPASDSPAAQANAALAATQIDAKDLADLRSWFVKLMNRGMYKEAENFAREMIAKWPTHATGYLCLGAALQDQGRPKAAIAVYTDCVSHAKTGDASECLHLGGTLKGRKR